ncbi:MAG: LLM class flavin-dependent oxidoreductase [Chloroflexi bacterium]|nr:LLM class flavin-dependent oxidoreductase [Chloroflexota bacterium]
MLTYSFRLPPGPRTPDYAALAEDLGYERVWCPETPAYGHDIWVALARTAERTARIGLGAAVLIPSYRHPLAQASAIATIEGLAPGRLWAGFGTGFTGRSGLGQRPLTLAYVRRYMGHVRGLLEGDAVELDGGGVAQILASEGWLPPRPIRVPLLLASQGPKGRALAREIADGLICLGTPEPGFEPCLASVFGVVLDDGEDLDSPRARAAVAPLVATAYHGAYARDPESVTRLPNGAAWLESVRKVPERLRHLSVHRGHALDVSNAHDHLIDVSIARSVSFTGTRDELRKRLEALETAGATGVIFGTSGFDLPRELRAFADVAGL